MRVGVWCGVTVLDEDLALGVVSVDVVEEVRRVILVGDAPRGKVRRAVVVGLEGLGVE